jgi:hypothetical protein
MRHLQSATEGRTKTMRDLTEAELDLVSGGQGIPSPAPPPGSNHGEATAFAVHFAKAEARLLGVKVGPAVSAAAHAADGVPQPV